MAQQPNLFKTAADSERGREFLRLWGGGMRAAKALDRAFGDGATKELARQVYVAVRSTNP